MKQIAAILIAFFLCAGATQVSAQKILSPVKTVAVGTGNADYVVEPTDEILVTTGTTLGIVKLPDPALWKWRVLRIIQMNTKAIQVHQFQTGSLYPFTGMLSGANAEWICDGDRWRVLSKNY